MKAAFDTASIDQLINRREAPGCRIATAVVISSPQGPQPNSWNATIHRGSVRRWCPTSVSNSTNRRYR